MRAARSAADSVRTFFRIRTAELEELLDRELLDELLE
jgi:hypothetical protein